MNEFSFDKTSGVLSTETGVILQNAQEKVREHGFETPYNLGSRGSCTIGGNLSTKAGGVNFVKYGSLRGYVLGLEVVLANGDILNMMKKVPKDNTGIDLKHLFIGAEGALGVITQANILCKHAPKAKALILLKLRGFGNVLSILNEVKMMFGGSLSAVEYMDWESYYMYSKFKNDLHMPLDFEEVNTYHNKIYDGSGFSVNDDHKEHFMLVELSGESDNQLNNLIELFIERNANLIENSVMAQNDTQRQELWMIREEMVLSLSSQATLLKYDICFDPKHYEKLTQLVRQNFFGQVQMVCSYGHIADGDSHLTVMFPKGCEISQQLRQQIDTFVYKFVIENDGSISAEHGIGMVKKDYLPLQKSDLYIQQMRKVKKLFDPNNILNPHKMINI